MSMPLHDRPQRTEWDGVRFYWLIEIVQWLKCRLPRNYRAIIASSPIALRGGSIAKTRESVANISALAQDSLQPDFETVVATLEEDRLVLVEKNNFLIAAVEIISPVNKDRSDRRDK
jgi:hypothetical protein